MTLIERSPNLISATGFVGKLFARHDVSHKDSAEEAEVSQTDGDVNDTPEPEGDALANHYGDQASAFRLMKLISATDAEGANIIGIIGAHRGSGTSVTSRQLAGAFASFGRKVLLIDASAISAVADDKPLTPIAQTLKRADAVNDLLSFLDLGNAIDGEPLQPKDFASALRSATQSGRTIIVDLPPVVSKDGRPNTAVRGLADACDLVFLVCLTGQMRRKELSECVETCRVVGVKLNGLVLNDWQLPASRLLES